MPESEKKDRKPSQRSPDFRYYPCDSFNIAINDHSVKLHLGVEEVDGTVLDFVAVHMTHKTAAVLKVLLEKAFTHYEGQTGVKIPVPDSDSFKAD